MRRVIISFLAFAFGLAGCFGIDTSSPSRLAPPDGATAGGVAGPSAPVSDSDGCGIADASLLFSAVDDSVHELIACGGAQVSLAKSFVTRILLSNPDAFDLDEDTRDQLESLLGSPDDSGFARDTDGGFVMGSVSPGRALAFTVYFADGEQVVRDDPLRLESYLEGVQVVAAHTHDEMMADWELDNEYIITWDAPGPLAHLINDGEPLPPYIRLRLSVWDFVYLYLGIMPEDLDFGPFTSLGEVNMDSLVSLEDRRAGAAIEYSFSGDHMTVADLDARGVLGFTVEGLDASYGALALTGETSDLRYSDARSGLAGTIRYTITGPDTELLVVSDFGEGRLYPISRWRCDL